MMNVPVTMSGQMVVCAGCGLAYQVPPVQPFTQPFVQPPVPQSAVPPPGPPYVPAPVYPNPPPPAPGAPVPASPAAALPPLEVLAPPRPSAAPKADGEQHPVESPTAALPPAVTKAWQEAVRNSPKSHGPPLRETHEHANLGEAAAKDDRVFPSSATTPAKAIPPAHQVAGAARDEFSAVEARLQQARQKTRVTIFVAVFGIVVMMLFAWFVVNLSRPQ
jgi:hypothetical protein